MFTNTLVSFFQTDQNNKHRTWNREGTMKTVRAVAGKGMDFLKAPKANNVPRLRQDKK
jgi:hypothetical protein